MGIITALVVLFFVLQFLDVYTTKKILSQGGRELNPILAPLMEKFGVDKTLYVSKSILIIFVLYAYFFNIAILDLTVMVVLNVIYTLVVIHNFKQIKK